MKRLFLSIALLTAVSAVPSGAQSLGEAAAREKERRQAKEKQHPSGQVPTFTDADLPKSKEAPKEPAKGEGQAGQRTGGSSRGEGGRSEGGSSGGDNQAAWTRRAENARRAREDAARNVAAVQARIDATRQKLNPQSRNYEIDTNAQLRLQDELRTAEGELKAAQDALAEADRDLEKLQEDARRAGASVGSNR